MFVGLQVIATAFIFAPSLARRKNRRVICADTIRETDKRKERSCGVCWPKAAILSGPLLDHLQRAIETSGVIWTEVAIDVDETSSCMTVGYRKTAPEGDEECNRWTKQTPRLTSNLSTG